MTGQPCLLLKGGPLFFDELPQCLTRRAQAERIAETDRIPVGEPIQVEAAGQAEGAFLRNSPD